MGCTAKTPAWSWKARLRAVCFAHKRSTRTVRVASSKPEVTQPCFVMTSSQQALQVPFVLGLETSAILVCYKQCAGSSLHALAWHLALGTWHLTLPCSTLFVTYAQPSPPLPTAPQSTMPTSLPAMTLTSNDQQK